MAEDFSRVNMDRYRSQRALAVGGPYGRRQRIQPFDPAPQLVFFDASLQIDSTQPDTNLFGPTNLAFSEDFDKDAGTLDGIQLFLKAETPFNRIRKLSLPTFAGITAAARFGGVGGGGTFTATQGLAFALIRPDMTPGNGGVADLELLTFNNGHARTNSFPATTALYNTATNFELFPVTLGVGSLNQSAFGILNPAGDESYQMTPDGSFLDFYFSGAGERARADDGPFNGIHIFWNPVGKAGHPAASPGATAIANLSAALTKLTVGTSNDSRAVITTDAFPVMEG